MSVSCTRADRGRSCRRRVVVREMRWFLLTLLLVVVLAGGAGAYVLTRDDSSGPSTISGSSVPKKATTPLEHAARAIDTFNQTWARGADTAASKLTDHPKIAASALIANRKGLDGATVAAKLLSMKKTNV